MSVFSSQFPESEPKCWWQRELRDPNCRRNARTFRERFVCPAETELARGLSKKPPTGARGFTPWIERDAACAKVNARGGLFPPI
jgi:hypothetical protein